MQKIRQGDWFQTYFNFLKKLYMRQKQVMCNLLLIFCDSPQIGTQKKETV